MSHLENVTMVVKDGVLWMDAADAALLVREGLAAQARENLIAWDKRERSWKAREQELIKESNAFNQKWCEAERRCGKLDRAEESLREYEKMIGDLRTQVERLKVEVDQLTPSKPGGKRK